MKKINWLLLFIQFTIIALALGTIWLFQYDIANAPIILKIGTSLCGGLAFIFGCIFFFFED